MNLALGFAGPVYLGDKGLALCRKALKKRDDYIRAASLIGLGVRNDAQALAIINSASFASNGEMKKCRLISLSLLGGLPLMKSIANTLSDRGVPTKQGRSARWSHSTVVRILARNGK